MIRFAVALLALLAVSGCAANRYRTPVGAFRDKVNRSTSVIADYYSSRNDQEMQVYLDELAADPSLRVAATDNTGRPTPIGKPVFSVKSLKARLDALDVIAVYATRLADLADSPAPADFKDGATALGENLGNLSKTFGGLAGNGDPTADRYVGPIANLVGAIGQIYLEKQRDAAIQLAIKKGAPEVAKILTQLKDDLQNTFGPLDSLALSQRLSTHLKVYNDNKEKMSFDERRKLLEKIADIARVRNYETSSAPASLVTSLGAAHEALVKLAQTKRKPKDFSEFVAELELWTARIEFMADQIRATRN